jgi:carbonic anhydrase
MCQYCLDIAASQKVLGRRSVLKFAGAAAGLALAPRAFAANDKPPPKPENVISPDAALDRLMQGNKRYVDGVSRAMTSSTSAKP